MSGDKKDDKPAPATSVDDKTVRKLINEALTNAGWKDDKSYGTINKAFRALQAYRQKPGNSLDLNYAAAEHYMFARLLVATGRVSQTQMKAMTFAYDAKKWLDAKTGDPNKQAVTKNPVSPPSWAVMMWGMKGATEGGGDKDRLNPDGKVPLWRSVNDVLGSTQAVGGQYDTTKPNFGYGADAAKK